MAGAAPNPAQTTTTREAAASVDAAGLAAALRRDVRGEVRFDEGGRALYATDGSNYRQVPIGVVLPTHVEDVVRTVEACRRFGAPILPRGAGTSLAGQCCNVAVVLDMSRHLNRILEIDPYRGLARVEPGVVLDNLRDAAEQHHLTFAPDPATHTHCTIGGMIGNNSCGVHSVMGGKTAENAEELEVLTYDGVRLRVGATSEAELGRIIGEGGRRGQIYSALKSIRDDYANLIRQRYPNIPRRVSGYNLDQLLPENGFHVARALVGTEGTCVTVLEATVRLVDSPPARVLLVLGYPDIFTAGDDVMEVLSFRPLALEGLDDVLIDDMKKKNLHSAGVDLLPDGRGWLMVEFGGQDLGEADGNARRLMGALAKRSAPPSMKLFDDPAEARLLWTVRESSLGATARVPGEGEFWEGWEDSAVPPERVGDYLRDLRRMYDRYGYHGALYGHLGQGCIHTRINFDLVSAEGIAKYRSFVEEAADLVVSYGGSLSGEHGDGQSRAELLPRMYGPELVGAFRRFKAAWDPDGKMNPGKVVDPYRLDENLRLGTGYREPKLDTHFAWVDDERSLPRALMRCVGVGKCRRESGGVMCPSYMVTRDEMHSTRGRARLLWEMLQGGVLRNGWRDKHVKEALDLCLACKGCKSDCPVNVDMATYKAEFLSHYYAGRLRPMSAYAFGLVFLWARLGSLAPRAANFLTQTPGLRKVAKAAAGVAPQRRIPRLASQTFRSRFRRPDMIGAAPVRSPWGPGGEAPEEWVGGPQIILWPDTFNNHFHPETAFAAVEVLEAAGFQVTIPVRSLCCGRPLYDYGMLETAKRLLRQVLDTLRNDIRAGVPVVVLEPSCAAVFRDELINLFPDDEDARRLRAQTFLLSELLEQRAPTFRPPRLPGEAVLHLHCHHRALMNVGDERAALAKLGLDVRLLESGCCGMAGAFGFEADHYAVSVAAGERVLLPAVRAAPRETLIVADGFSCREQIAQGTGRRALHLAEVIQLGLHRAARPAP